MRIIATPHFKSSICFSSPDQPQHSPAKPVPSFPAGTPVPWENTQSSPRPVNRRLFESQLQTGSLTRTTPGSDRKSSRTIGGGPVQHGNLDQSFYPGADTSPSAISDRSTLSSRPIFTSSLSLSGCVLTDDPSDRPRSARLLAPAKKSEIFASDPEAYKSLRRQVPQHPDLRDGQGIHPSGTTFIEFPTAYRREHGRRHFAVRDSVGARLGVRETPHVLPAGATLWPLTEETLEGLPVLGRPATAKARLSRPSDTPNLLSWTANFSFCVFEGFRQGLR